MCDSPRGLLGRWKSPLESAHPLSSQNLWVILLSHLPLMASKCSTKKILTLLLPRWFKVLFFSCPSIYKCIHWRVICTSSTSSRFFALQWSSLLAVYQYQHQCYINEYQSIWCWSLTKNQLMCACPSKSAIPDDLQYWMEDQRRGKANSICVSVWSFRHLLQNRSLVDYICPPNRPPLMSAGYTFGAGLTNLT